MDKETEWSLCLVSLLWVAKGEKIKGEKARDTWRRSGQSAEIDHVLIRPELRRRVGRFESLSIKYARSMDEKCVLS